MVENEDKTIWKDMIKRHWIVILILSIAFVGFIIGLVIVLNFQINTSWVGNHGTADIGEFSVGTALLFVIQLILWELLLVFLPGGCFFGIVGYYWWKKLITPEEKEFLKKKEEKEKKLKLQKHSGSAGGGFGGIITIASLIIILVQNNWLTPFKYLPFSYFIYTWLWGLIWILIIFGIPLAIIGLIWYLKYSK